MPDALEALILDLVEGLLRPRSYAEVIEAWRTSCPRLTVWEEATERGLLAFRPGDDGLLLVAATAAGREALAAAGRLSPATPR